ncbi:MAG: hypothetical protein GOV01_02600 [Candidatus Altiarchaeota archaeon]|nr:hypothetical protein [Candidatus Altiarchaeota archaeon]
MEEMPIPRRRSHFLKNVVYLLLFAAFGGIIYYGYTTGELLNLLNLLLSQDPLLLAFVSVIGLIAIAVIMGG